MGPAAECDVCDCVCVMSGQPNHHGSDAVGRDIWPRAYIWLALLPLFRFCFCFPLFSKPPILESQSVV